MQAGAVLAQELYLRLMLLQRPSMENEGDYFFFGGGARHAVLEDEALASLDC